MANVLHTQQLLRQFAKARIFACLRELLSHRNTNLHLQVGCCVHLHASSKKAEGVQTACAPKRKQLDHVTGSSLARCPSMAGTKHRMCPHTNETRVQRRLGVQVARCRGMQCKLGVLLFQCNHSTYIAGPCTQGETTLSSSLVYRARCLSVTSRILALCLVTQTYIALLKALSNKGACRNTSCLPSRCFFLRLWLRV